MTIQRKRKFLGWSLTVQLFGAAGFIWAGSYGWAMWSLGWSAYILYWFRPQNPEFKEKQ